MTQHDWQVGDEWSDGWGNFILTEVCADTVTSFDYEGLIDVQTHDEWQELIDELNMTPVTEPSKEERLAQWRKYHPNFPL